MSKKKKPKKSEQMHQHVDKAGVPFGRAHLLNVKHKKESTQKAHNDSLGDENG